MLAVINNTDITKHINASTYHVDAEDEFEEWKDGNFLKHRVITRERVKGSFDIVLMDMRGMSAEAFLSLLESATEHGALTITVWVNNRARLEVINAYYSIKAKKRNKLADGSYMDIWTITLEER